MQFTPVVPSLPSPEGNGSNPVSPPVMPGTFSPNQMPNTPAWARAQNFPNVAPYGNGTPYVQPMQVPGSYFVPPVALPPQSAIPGRPDPQANIAQGLSADWTGFPNGGGAPPGSPYSQAGSHPQTPFVAAGAHGFAAFTPYQPAMPVGFGMHPGAMPTAAMMGGGMAPQMMAGMMPGMGPAGMMGAYTPFAPPGAFGYTPHPGAAGLPPQGGPVHGHAPPQPQHHAQPGNGRLFRPQDLMTDRINKFEEGPNYGPVLPSFLVPRVHAKISLNPLLMPPSPDEERDFLHWNMLFGSAQCRRSSEPSYRSWSNGRKEPATWPRVDSIRLVSRTFPWTVTIKAEDPAIGVTCGDIIESVHQFMHTRMTKGEMDTAGRERKRILYEAFNHNRSSAHGVPGGRLEQTLFRFDWLGSEVLFGGIDIDPNAVKAIAGTVPPCMFVLVCMSRYPFSEAEAREQERREAAAEARSQRSRSRAHSRATASRATSRATSRSRATTVQSDDSD